MNSNPISAGASPSVFTVGHSNHSFAAFLALIRQHHVTAIGDVRSHPYSRFAPHFSRDVFRKELLAAGVAYVFLGEELGARSNNPACYEKGKVQYNRLAREPAFLAGIGRVVEGAKTHVIALMCAERDPIQCHRALLVSRHLHEAGVCVSHIKVDGNLEAHLSLESRLLDLCKLPAGDMFKDRADFVAEAYAIQGARVAYQADPVE